MPSGSGKAMNHRKGTSRGLSNDHWKRRTHESVFRIKTSRCLKFDFLSFKTNDGFYANRVKLRLAPQRAAKHYERRRARHFDVVVSAFRR